MYGNSLPRLWELYLEWWFVEKVVLIVCTGSGLCGSNHMPWYPRGGRSGIVKGGGARHWSRHGWLKKPSTNLASVGSDHSHWNPICEVHMSFSCFSNKHFPFYIWTLQTTIYRVITTLFHSDSAWPTVLSRCGAGPARPRVCWNFHRVCPVPGRSVMSYCPVGCSTVLLITHTASQTSSHSAFSSWWMKQTTY